MWFKVNMNPDQINLCLLHCFSIFLYVWKSKSMIILWFSRVSYHIHDCTPMKTHIHIHIHMIRHTNFSLWNMNGWKKWLQLGKGVVLKIYVRSEYIQSKGSQGLERVEKNMQSQDVCKVHSGADTQREVDTGDGEFLESNAG